MTFLHYCTLYLMRLLKLKNRKNKLNKCRKVIGMEVTDDIVQVAQELLENYKQSVLISGHNASGELVSTASSMVEFDGRYFEISFNLQKYWQYLENGTKPHFPPVSEIEKWVTIKHIVPTTINGKVPSTKQLAFLIARGISKKGTPATKLLSTTIDNSDGLLDRLADIIRNQLQQEINEEEI